MPGVKTITRRGAVWVEMPIVLLSGYQFSSSHDHRSWKTPNRKLVIESRGFAVERQINSKAFCMVFRIPRGKFNPTVFKKTSAVRHIFFQRSLRAIEELQSLDEKTLAKAVQAPTDYSVLRSALNTEEALTSNRAHDPLAGARLRGLEAKRKLVEAEGGALSTLKLQRHCRSPVKPFDKRRKERKLLGGEVGERGFRYPACQIGLAHLEDVLEALGDRDSWEQIGFFLNPSGLMKDRTPLEVLDEGKHDIGYVSRAASVYGEPGA